MFLKILCQLKCPLYVIVLWYIYCIYVNCGFEQSTSCLSQDTVEDITHRLCMKHEHTFSVQRQRNDCFMYLQMNIYICGFHSSGFRKGYLFRLPRTTHYFQISTNVYVLTSRIPFNVYIHI